VRIKAALLAALVLVTLGAGAVPARAETPVLATARLAVSLDQGPDSGVYTFQNRLKHASIRFTCSWSTSGGEATYGARLRKRGFTTYGYPGTYTEGSMVCKATKL